MMIAMTYFVSSRNLQNEASTTGSNVLTNSLSSDMKNSKCSNTKTTSDTGNDCFSVSDSDNQCCHTSFNGAKSCLPLSKNVPDATVFSQLGINDMSKIKAYVNSKLSGNVELKCSAEAFSDEIKLKVNKCAAVTNSSISTCKAFTDSDIQCCYLAIGPTGIPSLNNNSCIGGSLPFKIPSFALYLNFLPISFYCGIDDNTKSLLEQCAAIKPGKESDCTKISPGDVQCKYGVYNKITPMCIGMTADVSLIKSMNLLSDFQNIEIYNSSQTTSAIPATSKTNAFSIGYSIFAFLITLVIV